MCVPTVTIVQVNNKLTSLNLRQNMIHQAEVIVEAMQVTVVVARIPILLYTGESNAHQVESESQQFGLAIV